MEPPEPSRKNERLSLRAANRSRKSDGKFAKETKAAEAPLPEGSLLLKGVAKENPSKLTVHTAGKQCQIKKIDGVWTAPGGLHLTSIGKKFHPEFKEDNRELLEYTALVIAEMLNDGDIPSSHGTYVKAIRLAVHQCGSMLGLSGSWNRKNPNEGIPPNIIPTENYLVYTSAWLRCGHHLVQRLEQIDPVRDKQSLVDEWWWPYPFLEEDILLSGSGYYKGEDGRILERIAATSVEGINVFDADYRSNSPDITEAIARELVSSNETSEKLRHQANQYLNANGRIKHYHCGMYCKKRHDAHSKSCPPHQKTLVPCKEGYPCLLDDVDGFQKRYEVDWDGDIYMP